MDIDETGENSDFEAEIDESDFVEVIQSEDKDGIETDDADSDQENNAEVATDHEAQQDDSRLCVRLHDGQVFCIAANGTTIVSGSEDDSAKLWSLETGAEVGSLTGHKDSVTAVEFNRSASKLATGDLSGVVKIWDANAVMIQEFTADGDLQWMQWHPLADGVLFAGSESGNIWLWLIGASGEKCKVLAGTGSACTTGKLLADGKGLLAGYKDCTVRKWDIKNCQSVPISVMSPIDGSITCSAVCKQRPVAAVGTENGQFLIVQCDQAKTLSQINCSDKSEDASIEDLMFEPQGESYLAVGGLFNNCQVWDLSALAQRHTLKHPDGVTKLSWWTPQALVTGCIDGIVRLWDVRTGETVRELHGHQAEILDLLTIPERNEIVSASADNTCRVFYLQ